LPEIAVHAELSQDSIVLALLRAEHLTFRQQLHRVPGGSWARLAIRLIDRSFRRLLPLFSPTAIAGTTVWQVRSRFSLYVGLWIETRHYGSLRTATAFDDSDEEYTEALVRLCLERHPENQ
jgi:hypothetical protein